MMTVIKIKKVCENDSSELQTEYWTGHTHRDK